MSAKRDAISGAAAAGLAIGASELAAGLVSGLPSLVEGVGNRVIDGAPTPVKDFAITAFGTADKPVLLGGIVLVTLLLGALAGRAARDRFGVAIAAFVGFGTMAAMASAVDPGATMGLAMIPAGASALLGLAALSLQLDRAPAAGTSEPDMRRRRFLYAAGAVAGMAVLSAGAGRALIERSKRLFSGREDVLLPRAAAALPPAPPAADLRVPGLTPIFVPNPDFYRIDTALFVPRVDASTWQLRITGEVERPYRLTYGELLDMKLVERDVTLACVSNRVGGDLVGNARWLGVPLATLLDRAGVRPEGEQVVGRSVDGFTVGFPVEAAYDGRDALVAVGMNGEPLPYEHGFPARLIVAGLYGYVSATKWLSEIELTGWRDFDAYWVPRGWSKEAPIKTQSRIDTPGRRGRLPPGPTTVAGVAWASGKSVSRVEVRFEEDADWVDADLSEPLSPAAWVQWKVGWDASEGEHLITVRATDGDGVLQDERVRPPAPDGATGWHTVRVVVG